MEYTLRFVTDPAFADAVTQYVMTFAVFLLFGVAVCAWIMLLRRQTLSAKLNDIESALHEALIGVNMLIHFELEKPNRPAVLELLNSVRNFMLLAINKTR